MKNILPIVVQPVLRSVLTDCVQSVQLGTLLNSLPEGALTFEGDTELITFEGDTQILTFEIELN